MVLNMDVLLLIRHKILGSNLLESIGQTLVIPFIISVHHHTQPNRATFIVDTCMGKFAVKFEE